MFKNEDDFKNIVDRLNIDDKPNDSHRENLHSQMLSVFNKARPKTPHAGQWQTIRRTIMKRPITKLAAAAVIIIAVVLSITFLDKSVIPAYGITDLPELLLSAKTIHIKAWSYFPEATDAGKVQRRVALEKWFDLKNGLSRTMSAGYDNVPMNTTLRLMESVLDGEDIMSINHGEKSVIFYRLTPFHQKLRSYEDVGELITQMLGDPRKLDEFRQIGQEVIGSTTYEIWQGDVVFPLPEQSGEHPLRIRGWVSPTTGDVGRIVVQSRFGSGEWTNSYEVVKVERNIDIPRDIFEMNVPEGYKLLNTKDEAEFLELEYGPTCYQESLSVTTQIAFTMPDGSVIAAWSSEDSWSDESQAPIFENLTAGSRLPKLPIELYRLVSVGTGEPITYDGRHLLYTKKGDHFYEWSLYVPRQTSLARSEFLGYHPVPRFNPPKDRALFSLGLLHDLIIENEYDFSELVLGAIAELNDNGRIPENVTYESVLELAQKIRESLAE
jgi:hypothetical protein